jgi:ASCH domain
MLHPRGFEVALLRLHLCVLRAPAARSASCLAYPSGARVIRPLDPALAGRARRFQTDSSSGRLPGVRVLNFYSSVFGDQLRRGRKTATIRLGDKSHKYRKNECVLVTIGYQHSPREKIFYAVIDQVEVKRVRDLSPRDIEHDNPEFRRVDEMVNFLEQIYGRKVSLEDTVTVVRFSQIIENPPELRDRLHGLGAAQN